MTDSKKIEDGGPAYPTKEWNVHYDHIYREGMSLRDWFAGQALAGITAGLCSDASKGHRAFDRVAFDHAAKDAYMIADAMIAARKAGDA